MTKRVSEQFWIAVAVHCLLSAVDVVLVHVDGVDADVFGQVEIKIFAPSHRPILRSNRRADDLDLVGGDAVVVGVFYDAIPERRPKRKRVWDGEIGLIFAIWLV